MMGVPLKDAKVPCGSCRACCQAEAVDLIPEEGDDVAGLGGVPGLRGRMVLPRKPNGECAHLTAEGCGAYERRPVLCRIYDCRLQYLYNPERIKGAPKRAALERLHTLPGAALIQPGSMDLVALCRRFGQL